MATRPVRPVLGAGGSTRRRLRKLLVGSGCVISQSRDSPRLYFWATKAHVSRGPAPPWVRTADRSSDGGSHAVAQLDSCSTVPGSVPCLPTPARRVTPLSLRRRSWEPEGAWPGTVGDVPPQPPPSSCQRAGRAWALRAPRAWTEPYKELPSRRTAPRIALASLRTGRRQGLRADARAARRSWAAPCYPASFLLTARCALAPSRVAGQPGSHGCPCPLLS